MESPSVSILKDIWLSPRKVFLYIHKINWSYTIPYAVLSNIVIAFDFYYLTPNTPVYSFLTILLVFLGWIAIYLFSFFLKLSAKIQGLKIDTFSIFVIRVHSVIPSIIGLPLMVLLVILSPSLFVLLILLFTTLFLQILSFRFFIIGLSEITKTSVFKSFTIHLGAVLLLYSIPAIVFGILYASSL